MSEKIRHYQHTFYFNTGIGLTAPDPKGSFMTPDGVEIPMGKGCKADIGYSSLLYNEFIVYDVGQINMKYMFQMNFKYKW